MHTNIMHYFTTFIFRADKDKDALLSIYYDKFVGYDFELYYYKAIH